MDDQLFIDQILENESLTGDLEDGPAAQLLRWGTRQVSGLVKGLDDEELANAKVNALMAVMRQVARMSVRCYGAAAGELATELGRLLESHALAFDSTGQASADEVANAAAVLAELPPDRAMTFLLHWLDTRKG